MIKVLINAYACNPNWGSEQGIGWHWSIELAKYCKVFVITEGEFQTNIEKSLEKLPQKDNLTFIYNNVTDKVRKMCWNQGDWRFYYYYRKWQKRTLQIAIDICKKEQIDVIHQLNMQGFREPGLLWKIKGPKYVWGPVGGMGLMPLSYLNNIPLKKKVFFFVKNVINKIQYKYQPNVRYAINRADVLLASTPEEQRVFKNIYHRESYFVNDTGCDVSNSPHNWLTKENKSLNMVWVAKFDFRKQLELAIRIIGELKDLNVVLNIVGGGANEQYYKKLANELQVYNKCIFHGVIPHDEVMKIMQESDLFLFTSIKEDSSTVILEAIGSKLPIVCFDTCGFGPIVDDSIGRKVKIATPAQSIKDFAKVIRDIYNKRDLLPKMSENCLAKQKELSWQFKAEFVTNLYNQILYQEKHTFDILWIDENELTNQLTLTIKAVATAFHPDIRLHIVGSGDMEAYLKEAEKQGIADLCVIHGSVSHDEVLRIMGSADMFLFTSVAEGTPHVVLEAISMGLPVVCFDTCGQGDSVTDDIGMKIPLSHPEQSVKDFAERIEYLYKHREVLTAMSENCKRRAEELSWERKAKEMVRIYNNVKNEKCAR